MDDYISREQLLDRIAAQKCDGRTGTCKDCDCKVFCVYGVVEAFPAANVAVASQWISIKDMLPERGKTVLCWYEYFRFGNYNRLYQTYGLGYQYNGCWSGDVAQGHQCRVIAWMPLPEPPEEVVTDA